MGLDMYLEGEKYLWHDNERYEDGDRIKKIIVELGYWRKHPDLHGFIVKAFAAGDDDCEPICLDDSDINAIIAAIKEDRLPHTEGFFFGDSDCSAKDASITIFSKALKWLQTKDDNSSRTVYYRASW